MAKLLDEASSLLPEQDVVRINEQLYVDTSELDVLIPITNYKRPTHNISEGTKVLEVCYNQSALSTLTRISSLHIIYIGQPLRIANWDNVKILSGISKADTDYDIIYINESYEFLTEPLNFLIELKNRLACHGKIMARFRPWSASHGGFQELIKNNMPYSHILLQNQVLPAVLNKTIKPLQTYNSLISKSGLSIVSSQIHRYNAPLPEKLFNFVTQNLWNAISQEEAKKILAIHNVDYLLCR
jgi:hypothetical protein